MKLGCGVGGRAMVSVLSSGGGLLSDLRQALCLAASDIIRELGAEVESALIPWDPPPDVRFGDLSTPIALKLAKQLRKPPMEIASALRDGLARAGVGAIREITATTPGFVNIHLDASSIAVAVLKEVDNRRNDYGNHPPRATKVVVEHTNMNPNKAAHIGHVRNACLGDSLVRIFRRSGYEVEVQNYIDDTGAQVADVVLGFHHLGAPPPPEGVRFDHYCWDVYADVHRRFERDPELKALQQKYLHEIEQGHGEVAMLAKQVAERVLSGHLDTMWGLGIHYDLLTWESDIVRKGFWRHAFEHLRDQGSLVHETEGPNAGCWVVRLRDLPGFESLENPDKVLVRSNGTATYVAKDIAYQLWKFGVLGLDFDYRPYTPQPDGHMLYSSCPPGASEPLPPEASFGGAGKVINVIDIRQKYLQDVLRHSLRQLGYVEQADNSVHFSYEVVALSPKTAQELGGDVSGEAKAVYAMSGRKGIGVKADDLLAAAESKAGREVAQRHPEMTAQEVAALAHDIAVGAVRYYMVKFHTNTLIAFDFDEALAMQGNTGPYLQYACARARSILRRASAAVQGCPADPGEALAWAVAKNPFSGDDGVMPVEKALVMEMADFPAKILSAAQEYLPSIVAEYAYTLASSFTDFYEGAPVLSAPPGEQARRIALVAAFVQVMTNVLDTLGLPSPPVL